MSWEVVSSQVTVAYIGNLTGETAWKDWTKSIQWIPMGHFKRKTRKLASLKPWVMFNQQWFVFMIYDHSPHEGSKTLS